MVRKNSWFDVVNSLLLSIASLVAVYPLWHQVSLSLSSEVEAMKGGLFFWPREFTANAYKSVLTSDYIWSAFYNSIFTTIAGTVLSVLVTAALAYPLVNSKLPGRNVIIALVLFTMLFNGGIIPSYLLVKQLDLINSLWALILPTLVSAFNVIVMMSFFRGIPRDVEESATMDGANIVRIFFSIILPLSKPVLATIFLWEMVGRWNDFFHALIYLNDRALYTLPLLLKQIIDGQELASVSGEIGQSATESLIGATIMLSIIPIIAIYPYLQKYFVKGAMLGAVKS